MKNKIIGICGPARNGKDTIALMLARNGIDAEIQSLATPMKQMCQVLGLSERQLWGNEKEIVDPRFNATPRKMMQTLGTEWGRNIIDEDMWLNALWSKCEGNVIIPDIRFSNEARFVRKRGVIIHVIRPGTTIDSKHSSEQGVERGDRDFTISNNGTLEDLEKKVSRVAGYINNDWS